MKNSKLRRALLLAACAVLLVCLSVGATLAYLTDNDTVTNTFTVGKVDIKLDEAKANTDGTLVEGGERVKANSYKLLPGHTYNKDPMVTVLKGSESCYIKLVVVVTKSAELDQIFNAHKSDGDYSTAFAMATIFNGYDQTNWVCKTVTEDTTANTRTYEFWYKEAVDATNNDVALDALFDKIVVPGSITNSEIDTINGMTITITAHAMQKDGFATAEDAWKAYTKGESYTTTTTPAEGEGNNE